MSGRRSRERKKKLFALFGFIIILVFAIVVAWNLISGPTPKGTLVIHVVDEQTNIPIEGATVTIYAINNRYASSGETDEQGVYWFESIPAERDYRVVVYKQGYHEHPAETASVEAGSTTHYTFELPILLPE